MKTVLPLFTIAYGVVAGLFGIAGVVLMGFAFLELWTAVIEPEGRTLPARAAIAIESIGLVAVALVALEMAQTVAEEEVVRRVHVSAPTRVRRYLSRFLVVVVVALGIESLVAVVQALHERPETLPTPQASPWARQPSWQRGLCSCGSTARLKNSSHKESQRHKRRITRCNEVERDRPGPSRGGLRRRSAPFICAFSRSRR